MSSPKRIDPGFWRMAPGEATPFVSLRNYLSAPHSDGPKGQIGVTTEDLATLANIRLRGMHVRLVIGPAAAEDFLETGGAGNKTDALPHLALINLASFLRAYGARITVHDSFVSGDFTDAEKAIVSDLGRMRNALGGHVDPELDDIIARWQALVNAGDADLVGFSSCNEAYQLSLVLLKRRLLADGVETPLVMGGYLNIDEMTPWLGELDAVVAGEGEVPLLLICNTLMERRGAERGGLAWIPGVVAENNGRWQSSSLAQSMNVRTPPSLEGFELSRYSYQTYAGFDGVTIPYQMSVGCPYNCAYCNNAHKRRYKLRHPTLVLRDLDRLRAGYGVSRLFLLNSAFNCDKAYAETITRGLIAAGSPFRWCDCARPTRIRPEAFQRMRRAGCEWLNWGYDTLSNRLSRIYGRRVMSEHFGQVLADSAAAGIRNSINVVVGMPHENEDDVTALLEFFERHHKGIHWVFYLHYNFIAHSDIGRFPGRYGLVRRRDGAGVDEEGGMTWPERQQRGREYMRRIKETLAERYGYY